jgi:hypothetical protein
VFYRMGAVREHQDPASRHVARILRSPPDAQALRQHLVQQETTMFIDLEDGNDVIAVDQIARCTTDSNYNTVITLKDGQVPKQNTFRYQNC